MMDLFYSQTQMSRAPVRFGCSTSFARHLRFDMLVGTSGWLILGCRIFNLTLGPRGR